MQRMVIQRILIGLVTLWVVSVLVFVMTSLLPGDVAQIVLGQSATPESLAAYRAERGLNQPLIFQYFGWLGNMLTGDLGISKAGGATNWKGPYLKKGLPKDPWGNPYTYRMPGQQNSGSYDIFSAGPDGQEGSEDDVANWETENPL